MIYSLIVNTLECKIIYNDRKTSKTINKYCIFALFYGVLYIYMYSNINNTDLMYTMY